MFHFRKNGEPIRYGISFYNYTGTSDNDEMVRKDKHGIGILVFFPVWILSARRYYNIYKDAFYFGKQRKSVSVNMGIERAAHIISYLKLAIHVGDSPFGKQVTGC